MDHTQGWLIDQWLMCFYDPSADKPGLDKPLGQPWSKSQIENAGRLF